MYKERHFTETVVQEETRERAKNPGWTTLKKAPFPSCVAAISLSSCCTGNVHIDRTNQGGVGDVYAPVAWGMVLRRK